MNPEMFSIGGISIKWYSVLILTGVLIGYFLAKREGDKFKFPKDFIFDLVFYVMIFGIIGARLYYVIFNFSYYKDNLLEIFKIWNGGLAIHGGIIAGLITLIVYAKKKKVNPVVLTDIAVPSLIIAQAIGRWGNFFNSEAHGGITTLEHLQSLYIPKFIIDGMYIDGFYFEPTFFYESLWCIVGFILLLLIRKFYKKLKVGGLTCFYMIWYSIGRFMIESLRTDSLMLGSFRVAQIISIVMIVIGIIGIIYISFNKKIKYYKDR